MTGEKMPYNQVGEAETSAAENFDAAQYAAELGVDEAEWRAANLPHEDIEFRWRYTNKTIHLYERRLRSLRRFNVGAAALAWVRARIEWTRDNKLYELPTGVLVLRINTDGDVDIELEEPAQLPTFAASDIHGGVLPGTLWAASDGAVCTHVPELRHAADSLLADLAGTLGYEVRVGANLHELDAPELFCVSDEFGVIACEGRGGETSKKLAACFEKLWTLDR